MRILSIRRKAKKGGRWVSYRRPVDMAVDKEKLSDIYLQLYYYRTKGRSDTIYTFSLADAMEVEASKIVEPVGRG